MTDEIKIAVISDIHLGSRRNSTENIISNLNNTFPDNQETANLDVIFFAGDVFDRLLDFPDDAGVLISLWIHSFLSICSKYNILVRVLEGTPSHDRNQSEIFNTVNKIADFNVDLKYIKTLSIEYIDKFNINVLYVPDECNTTTDKTLAEVKELINSKGLTKVDFAIMHGNFSYQMPSHLKKIPRHDELEYLSLVEYYIFIGHIHSFSNYERIIAQGSFDRLSHGEEEKKGHVRAIINLSNEDKEFFFIENKSAKSYKTIKCYSLDLEETFKHIKKNVKTLPVDAAVRIEAEYDHPIFSNMNQLVLLHPTLTWTKLPKNNDIQEEIVNDETLEEYIPITINKHNIVPLLMSRITSTEALPNIVSRCDSLLKDIVYVGN